MTESGHEFPVKGAVPIDQMIWGERQERYDATK